MMYWQWIAICIGALVFFALVYGVVESTKLRIDFNQTTNEYIDIMSLIYTAAESCDALPYDDWLCIVSKAEDIEYNMNLLSQHAWRCGYKKISIKMSEQASALNDTVERFSEIMYEHVKG